MGRRDGSQTTSPAKLFEVLDRSMKYATKRALFCSRWNIPLTYTLRANVAYATTICFLFLLTTDDRQVWCEVAGAEAPGDERLVYG